MSESIVIMTIGPLLTIVPTIPPLFVGQPGAISFSATGAEGLLRWTLLASDLPGEWDAALTITDGVASLEAETLATPGSYSVRVRLSDATRIPVEQTFGVRIVALPIEVSGTLDAWTVTVAIDDVLTLSGGTGDYVGLSAISGALPAGASVALVGDELQFTGSPTASGAWSVVLRVTDSSGAYLDIPLSGNVEEPVVPSLADTILALSPWGYWRLNETGALTTAADSSGNARHGTYRGDAAPAAALYGGNTGSVEFSAGGCVNLPTATRTSTDAHTVVAFITSKTTSGSRAIVGADDFGAGATPNARVFQFRRDSATLNQAVISPSVVFTGVDIGLDASDTPMLVAFVFDPTRSAGDGVVRIYKDGAEVVRSASSISNNQTHLEWTIGAHNHDYVPALTPGAFDYGWIGRISDVAIFTGRLEDADIAAIWAARNDA